jgi:hypothetical protein
VVFNDVKSMTHQELLASTHYAGFTPLQLPKLNEMKRKSWPAMVFVRDARGRLMLWALSAEQYEIIQRMEWRSLQ